MRVVRVAPDLLRPLSTAGRPWPAYAAPVTAAPLRRAAGAPSLAAGAVPSRWGGAPLASVVAPTCRRTGCGEPAGEPGLCEEHVGAQERLRAAAGERLRERAVSGATRHSGDLLLAELAGVIRAREPPWRRYAACRGQVEVMFPKAPTGAHAAYSRALVLCASCPVVDPCREAGARERFGVWGGTRPPNERRRRG